MLTTILLGIGSSIASEIVTWLNKKLQGTVLKGDGAFILTFAIALAGALIKQMTTPGFELSDIKDYAALSQTFGEIFTVSQVYFVFVAKKLGIEVKPESDSKTYDL